MNKKLPYLKKAFTLIELLVVIGILTVLFAIVLVAINPARQFQQANDTQRKSDVNAILSAIHQYAAENKGQLPAGITTAVLEIKSSAGGANICSVLVTKYIAGMPVDPKDGTYTDCTNYSTAYTVVKSSSDNRVTVAAIPEVSGTTITVTR